MLKLVYQDDVLMEKLMRYRLLICGSCPALAVLMLALAGSSPATALAGCCKQRVTINAEWQIKDFSLKECKALNVKHDKDIVLKKTGLVWWDITC